MILTQIGGGLTVSQPDQTSTQTTRQRFFYIFAIILAGEAIFSLPFLIQRVFRPTLLKVFEIDNFELGIAFSFYGLVAIASYFIGGPLADRFSVRKLMSVALITTAFGGFAYAEFPQGVALKALYGYWGCTTILLFWAAMIKATRVWGGTQSQGRAFGILDGGRGLFAALLATLTVWIFARLLPSPETQDPQHLAYALKQVMWIATGFTFLAAGVVWFAIPDELHSSKDHQDTQQTQHNTKEQSTLEYSTLDRFTFVMKTPAVWLQGLIVITAYCGYKANDNLGLYAQDVFNFKDVDAASLSTLSFWVRPFAAFGAGLIGDRISPSLGLVWCFTGLLIGYLAPALNLLSAEYTWGLYMTVVSTSVFVFGLRGLYFAIMEEAQIPSHFTGTAVGVVSVIGYLPDLFIGPLIGYLNKTYPGVDGHVYVYQVLLGFTLLGLGASLLFRRVIPSEVS